MCTSKSREAKCFWRVAEDPVSDIQHHKPPHLGFILQTSIKTEGCALQGLSRGASAVIKDYAVVPKETEPAACAEEPRVCDEVLPTVGGHVLSPILTCRSRSIPDLTEVGSTSCLYLSVYHPSLCLHMHADYGICVELRAQLYGIGSSLYLQVYPGEQTQVIRFVLVLGSKHNSCML